MDEKKDPILYCKCGFLMELEIEHDWGWIWWCPQCGSLAERSFSNEKETRFKHPNKKGQLGGLIMEIKIEKVDNGYIVEFIGSSDLSQPMRTLGSQRVVCKYLDEVLIWVQEWDDKFQKAENDKD